MTTDHLYSTTHYVRISVYYFHFFLSFAWLFLDVVKLVSVIIIVFICNVSKFNKINTIKYEEESL